MNKNTSKTQTTMRFIFLYLLLCYIGTSSLYSQVNFTQSELNFNSLGDVDDGVTSLMYGPDNRLYVVEYPGIIKILTIQRNNADDYVVTAVEELNGIQTIVNHNDDGTLHSSILRETIGLTVVGTPSNPVIYVSSSDFRIGAGNGGGNGDVGLDTNSGIITRFSWNGTSWDVVDLVRGLPRSEENHATNGLEFATINGNDYLIVAQGGHTNAGSPSTNFVFTCEYALSGAVLSVDLTALEALPILNDNGRDYIYDLPTLDDPTRANANGIDDPDIAGYDGVDINDPFGGNDGLNQAVVVPGGPVQIFSPGYRNAYDLVLTESGALYVTDNGANGGWGGLPANEGGALVTNDYDPNEPGSSDNLLYGEKVNNKDHLELVTTDIANYTFGSFYAGHPNPTRGNPTGAGLYTDDGTNQVFRTLIYDPSNPGLGFTDDPALALPANWATVVPTANPIEGDWRGPGITNPDGPDDTPVVTWSTNTNGIDEYTATNFGGILQGNLFAGTNNGLLRRVELNANGLLSALTQDFLSGIGGDALGVTCNGDFEIFPGSIWTGTLNGSIVVFEPQDFVACISPNSPSYDPSADYDADGYTNQDEEDNGTDPCNGGSQPDDFDKSSGGILISNLNDIDDDFDGVVDALDPFQLGDPSQEGSDAFTIPINNALFSNQQGLGGIFGLGMTGLMNNGDTGANWLNWIDRRDDPNDPNPNDILGGAPGIMTSHMTSGTALGLTNTQEKAYQYGVQTDVNSPVFTVIGGMNGFSGGTTRLYGNTAAVGGELGFFIGDGTQSNYIKFVVSVNGFTALQEIDDVPQTPIQFALPIGDRPSAGILFYFEVNPLTGLVTLAYSIDDNARTLLGTLTAEGNILQAIQSTSTDLAVGFIGTSGVNGVELEGSWDFLNVIDNQPVVTQDLPDIIRVINDADDVIDLNNFFNDNDGVASLSYEVLSNTDGTVMASVSNNLLTLSYPNIAGAEAAITIRATDLDGLIVDQTFSVTVNETVVLFRVNAGGPEISAIDGGMNWSADQVLANSPYLIEPGDNMSFEPVFDDNFDPTVDTNTTPSEIFDTERFDATPGAPNMTYSFPVVNGNYEVRIYVANGYDGTSEPGDRIFNIFVEGFALPGFSTIDLSANFGHQVASVITGIVTVSDLSNPSLDISFVHGEIENPLVNGIEIIKISDANPPIYVEDIADQLNLVNDELDASLAVVAFGGSGNLNFTATGLPPGVTIEPTNGTISGTIASNANINSPYTVVVTVDDQDGSTVNQETITFTWEIINSTVNRINAGGISHTTPNLGVEWEDNSLENAQIGNDYAVSTGNIVESPDLLFENRDSSLPAYIDEVTFNSLFSQTRYDEQDAIPMEYTLDVDNGNYEVRLYIGDDFIETTSVGDRIFDISIEDNLEVNDFDLVTAFGHTVVGMLKIPVTVTDGELNIKFDHEIQNPIINAIEVYAVDPNFLPLSFDPIASQIGEANKVVNLQVLASGGDTNEAFTYFISGQPDGVTIDPLTGLISGVISTSAIAGGPNNDGNHLVKVTVLKDNSAPVSIDFIWDIGDAWIMKFEDQNYSERHELSFVQVGDKFYVLGGRENTRNVDIYDYTTDSWTTLEDSAPFDFSHFQAVEYQGMIWVMGALITNTFPLEIPQNYIWIFDPSREEWIKGPEIPVNRRRGSTGVVMYNDKFYISGGNINGHDGGFVPWFDEFDPATGVWTPLSDAPNARDHFFASLIDDKMYLAGGRQSGGAEGVFKPLVAAVDVYDFTTNTWSTIAEDIPTPRGAPASVNFNDKLVVTGGEVQGELVYGVNTTGAVKVTEIYDPITQSWSRGADLNNQRHGAQALVSGSAIYILGGSPNLGGGNQLNMEYFGNDIPAGTPKTGSSLEAIGVVEIADNTSEIISISIDGDTGVYVKNIEIVGANATDFTITSGSIQNVLWLPSSTQNVEVNLTGDGTFKEAILRVHYGDESTLDIGLANGNIAPIIVDVVDQFNIDGDTVTLPIVANDESTSLSYSATNLPPTLMINPNTGVITGTLTEEVLEFTNVYQEANGVVLIEAESGDHSPGFGTTTIDNAIGIIGNSDHLTSQNGAIVSYDIEITTPGVYRFTWHSAFNGDNPTDENDSWLRFPNDENVWFFGLKGSIGNEVTIINNLTSGIENNTVYPKGSSRVTAATSPEGNGNNGFFKVYRSGGNPAQYGWQARTSDNDPHDIYVYFANAGTYPMEIAERSLGHAIDKIAMYKVDDHSLSNSELSALPASNITDSGTAGASFNSPYTVTISVTDDANPALTAISEFLWYVNEVDNEAPTAIATANIDLGSVPLPVTFTGVNSTDDNLVISYFWDFGNGDTSTEINPQYTYTIPGNYTASLTVRDAGGLLDTAQIPIVVKEINNPPAAIITADLTLGDSPLTVNFTGSTSTDDDNDIIAYSWNFGNGDTSLVVDPTYVYTEQGEYTVTLTVTDSGGLSDSETIVIVVDPIPVNGVTVDPIVADLFVEETIALTATVSPSDATFTDVTWSSNDTATATVDANGVVTAVGVGTATITVTTNDGDFTATAELTISPILVTEVTVDQEAVNLLFGATTTLVATVLPSEATDPSVTWSSSDNLIATVDDNGLVTAVGIGTAMITVTTTDGGFVATTTITVSPVPVAVDGIAVNPETESILLGETILLEAIISPLDATDISVVWTTSDETIATVDENGLVTAVGEGIATITVTTNDGNFTATAELTINPISVTEVTIAQETENIVVGTTTTLVATVLPSDATDASVTWSSSDSTIATVDANGLVTGTGVGTVTITATTTDGGLEDTAMVEVLAAEILVDGVTVTPETANLLVGETTMLSETVSPSDATDTTVTWNSSDDLIATVDENGIVTAVGVGVATITVITNDGSFTAATEITITLTAIPVDGVTVTPETADLLVGETIMLAATVSPSDVTDASVTWSSSDDTIATVDTNGIVTAEGMGTVTITVTTTDGEFTGTVIITILVPPTAVDGVEVSPEAASLLVGETTLLEAVVSPLDATDTSVLWNSSNDLIATVDANGLVTAESVGTTTITVTTIDGAFVDAATIEVSEVGIPVSGVTVTPETASLFVGEITTLTATVSPSDATDTNIVWSSSDDLIATVDVNGLVTAIGLGTTTIIVTTTDGEFVATATITVNPIVVTGITVDPLSDMVEVGTTMSLIATVLPSNADNQMVVWTSSDETIATVDANGLVTGTGIGVATITATTVDGGFVASAMITVNPTTLIPVDGVIISSETTELPVGETTTLTATVSPSDATDTSVVWSSSDETITTVDANGVVTAVGVGTATITVTTTDGGFVDTAIITVTPAPIAVDGVMVTPEMASLLVGETTTLIATVSPLEATDTSVVWSSSNTTTATVDESGLVTAQVVGTATITATTTDGSFIDSATITVGSTTTPVSGLSVSPETASLLIGEIEMLTAIVSPTGATDTDVVWSSSDETIATVDINGLVTAIGVGTAIITVTTANGIFADTATITVNPIVVTGVMVDPLSDTIEIEATTSLTAIVSPLDATDTNVVWSSSDETIATVDANGLVTGTGIGVATITVTTADGNQMANAIITVTPVPIAADGVVVSSETTGLLVGETTTLTATVSPSDATDTNVIWSSSDETIATVDANGIVTAVGVGTVTITVTTVDGEFVDTITIAVAPVPVFVTSVEVNPAISSVLLADTIILTANVLPSNADNQMVLWSSSNTSVATVDANGVVTGESIGTSIITVTTVDGIFTATASVDVVAVPISVTGIAVTPETAILVLGGDIVLDNIKLTAIFSPLNATNTDLIWSSSDTTVVSVDANGIVQAIGIGTATITVATVDGGFTATAILEVLPTGSNVAPLAVASSDILIGNAPLVVNFTAENSTDNTRIVSYNWDFGTGGTSNQISPRHTFNIPGVYTVVLKVTDEEGLANEVELIIEVQNNAPLAVEEEAILFPNPARGTVEMLISNSANTSINRLTIHQLAGKMVKSIDLKDIVNTNGNYEIPIGDLRTSLYYVYLYSNNDSDPIIVLKLLVEN